MREKPDILIPPAYQTRHGISECAVRQPEGSTSLGNKIECQPKLNRKRCELLVFRTALVTLHHPRHVCMYVSIQQCNSPKHRVVHNYHTSASSRAGGATSVNVSLKTDPSTVLPASTMTPVKKISSKHEHGALGEGFG